MLSSFHSAVVDVRDFDSGISDYARLLGQEPDWIEANTERGTRSALFPLANTMLEIRAAENAVEGRSTGLSGFRLGCDDVDGFAGQLEQRSIAVEPSIVEKAERFDAVAARTWVSTNLDPTASRSIPVELISDEAGDRPMWIDPTINRRSTRRSTRRGTGPARPRSIHRVRFERWTTSSYSVPMSKRRGISMLWALASDWPWIERSRIEACGCFSFGSVA